MYLPDLSTREAPMPSGRTALLRNVGWLSRDMEYPRGPIALDDYRRLVELCREPFQTSAAGGAHECDLCQFEGVRSSANVFIPSDGFLYFAPVMICHYINAHHYRPPDSFLKAVAQCPEMNSMAYKRLLVATYRK